MDRSSVAPHHPRPPQDLNPHCRPARMHRIDFQRLPSALRPARPDIPDCPRDSHRPSGNSLGLLERYFLPSIGDLPGGFPGPFHDLRTTFGHLFATSLGSIRGGPGGVSGLFRNGSKTKKGSESGQIPSDRDENKTA